MTRLSRRDALRLFGLGAVVAGGGLLARRLGLRVPDAGTTPPPGRAAPSPTRAPVTGARPDSADEPDLEVALRAVPDEVSILPGRPTRVWRYRGQVLRGPQEALQTLEGSYLGPIFRVRKGWRVRVHFSHELPEESIVHWHGLHVPPEDDGHPRFVIPAGETYVYDFEVLDRSGTYWYHPHPHGRTGPQVYYGLAGFFLIHDEEEEALGLPTGEYDIPLVIQDRIFDAANQWVYGGNMMTRMMGFLGNRILVNGQPDYTLSVAARPYRLRLLNGSNARIYKLAWDDGTPLTVIGTEDGLLERPVEKAYVTLGPAQRVDIWVDFSTRAVGERRRLLSLAHAAPGGENAFVVLTAEVVREARPGEPLPQRLSTIPRAQAREAVNASHPRTFVLAMTPGLGWTLNGRTFEMTATAADEEVRLGDLEVWSFINASEGGMGMGMGMGRGMMGMRLPHPMHVHGLQFQILRRRVLPSAQAMWDTLGEGFVNEGWHDTVLVMPGEQVDILLRFTDFEGLYLYHCHNLEHEDMGMMRNYRVVRA